MILFQFWLKITTELKELKMNCKHGHALRDSGVFLALLQMKPLNNLFLQSAGVSYISAMFFVCILWTFNKSHK